MNRTATPSSKPDLLVLDLDGTMTNISRVAAKIASASDKTGIAVSSLVYGIMSAANDAYKATGVQNELMESVKKGVLNTLGREQKGVFDMILGATANNIRCAVLSNGPEQWGLKTLERLGLTPYFTQTVFRGEYLKPDPRALLPILDAHADILGEQGTVWVYGDRRADALLAYNTNTRTAHHIVPIAIENMVSAGIIKGMKSAFNAQGIVFESVSDISRALEYRGGQAITEGFEPLEPGKCFQSIVDPAETIVYQGDRLRGYCI